MEKTDLTGYTEYLKTRGITNYLTLKNYTSQINTYIKTYSKDIGLLPEFLHKNNIPIRKIAILKYLDYLETIGVDVKIVRENIQHIKTKQNERKELQTLSYENAVKLIKFLKKNKKYKLALITMIGFDTGSRVRAILKLRGKDVNIKDNKAYLLFSEKRGKIIMRLITDETYHWLKKVLPKDPEVYLFFKPNKRITNKMIDEEYYELWSDLKNISRKLFGVGVSFHWIRRGAGNYIYDKTKKNIVAVSEFYGHSSPKMTQLYLKVQAKEAEHIIEKAKREW